MEEVSVLQARSASKWILHAAQIHALALRACMCGEKCHIALPMAAVVRLCHAVRHGRGGLWGLIPLVALCNFARVSQAQLRIVTYNTVLASTEGIDVVLQAIGEESVNGIAKPIDILALQEQVSMETTTQEIVDVLNRIYGDGVYARSTVDGESYGAGRPGLIYNTQTITLLQEMPVGHLGADRNPRQTVRYRLRPVGYDAQSDFFLYNSHLKGLQDGNNPQRREAEARTNRGDADSLGDGVHVMYVGDLNFYGSREPGYRTLLSPGNGQARDPLDQPGTWHNAFSFRRLHTQSTTVAEGEHRSGGGMDDRFDFQLVSDEFMDGNGLSYIGPGVPDLHVPPDQHSYHAFGNDGTHRLNGDISTGRGAASTVLAALEAVSDHLPVVADFQLPARIDVSVEPVSPRVILGSEARMSFTVENTAPAVAPIGADRLRYSALGNGAVRGALIDFDDALERGNTHSMALDTSSLGPKTGDLFVGTNRDQVPEPMFSQPIGYDVVDHANASFDPSVDRDVFSLDLGSFPRGSGGGVQFLSLPIYNLETMPDFTAALELDVVASDGDVATLSANFEPARILGGESAPLLIALDTTVAGEFSASWTIATRDEPVPGMAVGANLVLDVAASVYDVPRFEAGDANRDYVFDQRDIIQVLQGAKYLSGQVATWGEGDWTAPAGGPWTDPPFGDGLFDQRDVVAALAGGLYLQGPYAAIAGPLPKGTWTTVEPIGNRAGGPVIRAGLTVPQAPRAHAYSVPEPPANVLLGLAMIGLLASPCRLRGRSLRELTVTVGLRASSRTGANMDRHDQPRRGLKSQPASRILRRD